MVGARRNFLLVLAVVIALILTVNGAKRLSSFRGTSDKVEEAQSKLEKLRVENEQLKRELEYKRSERFAEKEIRNKLGLAKEGEEVYIVPRDEDGGQQEASEVQIPNWRKWQRLIFGS